MKAAGLAEYVNVVRAEQTSREVQIAAKHLLQGRERPEAIFCWTDFIAFEVISVANELGLSIPDDLAIVGYDNTHYCDLAQNALTSVDQSGQVLGLQAARLLVERVEGRTKAEHFVVTPRLVVRRSSQGMDRGRFPRSGSAKTASHQPEKSAHGQHHTTSRLDRHRYRQGSVPSSASWADGKIVLRLKIKRLALAETFKKLPPCVVGIEACLSAHFVSRFTPARPRARIIPAIYVKPFVKGKRTTTTTPRRSPKRLRRTCGPFGRRLR